jgi:hypothetical protein
VCGSCPSGAKALPNSSAFRSVQLSIRSAVLPDFGTGWARRRSILVGIPVRLMYVSWELTPNMDSQAKLAKFVKTGLHQPRDDIKPDNQCSPTRQMDHFRKFIDETELRTVVGGPN